MFVAEPSLRCKPKLITDTNWGPSKHHATCASTIILGILRSILQRGCAHLLAGCSVTDGTERKHGYHSVQLSHWCRQAGRPRAPVSLIRGGRPFWGCHGLKLRDMIVCIPAAFECAMWDRKCRVRRSFVEVVCFDVYNVAYDPFSSVLCITHDPSQLWPWQAGRGEGKQARTFEANGG